MASIRCAELGDIIIIARPEGDRPAMVTKVFTATCVEACANTPMPELIKVASIHVDRKEAIGRALAQPGAHHGYWKAKA